MSLMVSCKEATYLASQMEEGKLPFIKKIKLKIHLAGCKFCKMFAMQSAFIASHSAQTEAIMAESIVLPDTDKQRINSALRP